MEVAPRYKLLTQLTLLTLFTLLALFTLLTLLTWHSLAHSCTRFPCYLGMEI